MKHFSLLLLITAVIATALPHTPQTSSALATTTTLTLSATDLIANAPDTLTLTADGLTLNAESNTAVYTTNPITAPIPFNAVVPEWLAHTPDSSSLEILLRTRTATGNWSDWFDLHTNDDWATPEDDHAIGDMFTVPASDGLHQYVQLQLTYGRNPHTLPPTFQEVRLVFINSTNGPTTEEMIAQQQALDAAQGISYPNAPTARPFVISRQVWCTAVECNYSDGLEYSPATNLIMHHTVSSNSSSDWAATIRAIWEYHTFSRGWGDIGYNYLVDRNGVIYEGHNSQDFHNLDVVGTHSGAANEGSMAASLLGTFTSPDEHTVTGTPTAAMMNAIANLFAWKAAQRSIDPYGSTRMIAMTWGLPNIMGHRDVYGGLNTLCPGGNAHALLPWLRNEVASRIGYVNSYIYVHETGSGFTKSATNWYEAPAGCGNNNHAYYTWSTSNPSASRNWGEWRPTVPANGRYRIEIHAPYCNTDAPETTSAHYQITHTDGVSTITINQDAQVGLWMSLGEFNLTAGANNRIRLTDLTFDNNRGVWFDGLRLIRVEDVPPEAANLTPEDGIWLTQANPNFTWQITSTLPIAQTRWEVGHDITFATTQFQQTWNSSQLSHTPTFTQNIPMSPWRVTVQTAGSTSQVAISNPTWFGVDMTPPQTAVTAIYTDHIGNYILYWQGLDQTSGIDHYTLQIRPSGTTTWNNYLTHLSGSNAYIVPPTLLGSYEFRVHATDKAGNQETPHSTADISTHQAILLPHAIMMPVIQRASP